MAGVAGSQPQDLANPNPVAAQQIAANSNIVNTDIAQMTMPSPQINAPVPAPDVAADQPAADADPLAALADQHAAASSDAPSADPLDALASSFGAQSDSSVEQQATESGGSADFMTRMKAGFAGNDTEKKAYLQQQYGKDAVRKTDKGFFVRESGSWKKFNNDWFGMGDPANLGRQAVVEAGALPAEATAAAASIGEGATGVGGIGIPMTIGAGRVAGGAMGEYAARIAANAIGIPRGEQSTGAAIANDAAAAITQGGIRAVFGHVFDAYTSNGVQGLKDAVGMKQTATEALDQAMKPMLDQTQAAIAKMATTDPLRVIAPEKAAASGINDALALNEAAKKSGINLRPDELFPNNPELQQVAKTALASKEFQANVMARGEQAAKAVEKLGDSFKVGEDTAQTAVAKGSVVDRAFARLIGQSRTKAIEAAKAAEEAGKPSTMQMPELTKSLGEVRKMFGFDEMTKPKPSEIKDLAEGLNIPLRKAQFIIDRTQKLTDELGTSGGKLTPERADQLYNIYKNFADNHWDAMDPGNKAFQAFKTIRTGLRNDFSNGMGQFLGDADKAAYELNMQRFSELKTASAGLKQLFGTDSPSTSAIVEYMRNGGIKNADRIADLKTVIANEHPEAWEAIGKSYFDRLMSDHMLDGAEGQRLGNVNWTKLTRTLDGNKKVAGQLEAIIGPARADALANLSSVMSAAQQSDRNFVASPAWYAKATKAIIGMVKLSPDQAVDALAADHAATKLLTSDKAAALINKYPLKVREQMQLVLGRVTAKAMKNLTGQQATRAIENAEHGQQQQ